MLALRKLLFASLAGLALCAAASPAFARPSYPIKAADYRKQVEKRIDNLWASIEKKLDFHNVTTERKKAIRKMLDEEARPVWVEVERVGADGNVTRDEALKVRELQTGLRGKLRTRMAAAKKAENEPAAASKPAATTAAKPAATTAAKPAAT
ncbi:MAG TPA: hypothetical protein PLI95_06200, partial [Polyangiaceae bacterium]|nr:hypothetical protein [Polyangiaceae bacterium]